MLRIVVKHETIETKNGEKNGRKWEIREQSAYLETSDERKRIAVQLKDGAAPYKAGVYDVGEESFYVDQFGQLGLRRLVLVAVVSAARVAG